MHVQMPDPVCFERLTLADPGRSAQVEPTYNRGL